MTKIINLFAGPGAGKSTTAAGVFYQFKLAGINAELVTEVAKDMTWARRIQCLKSQPLIFGKQLNRIERLIGQVDYVITDSPVLLSAIYINKAYPDSFIDAIVDIFNTFDNANYFIRRVKAYKPIGRRQSEASARMVDEKINAFLLDKAISYSIIDGNEQAVIGICDDILGRLGRNTGIASQSPAAT